jgi:hypothetical protein
MRRLRVSIPCRVCQLLKGASEVAQDLDPGLNDERRQADAEQVVIDQAVVGGIRGGEVGEAAAGPVEAAAVDDDAADRCAVPADELGGAVGDDVCAPLEWAEKIGCGEGIVDHDGDVVFLRDRGHLFEREDGDIGIPERLAVQDLGVGADGLLEVRRVGRVDQRDLDAEAGEGVIELVVGTAVEAAAADDVVAGAA